MPAPTPVHLRRVALSVVAATAVVLGPTACDLGVAGSTSSGPGSSGYGSTGYGQVSSGGGHTGHALGGASSAAVPVVATDVQTVPAGNVQELAPSDPPPEEPADEYGAQPDGAEEDGQDSAEEGAQEGGQEGAEEGAQEGAGSTNPPAGAPATSTDVAPPTTTDAPPATTTAAPAPPAPAPGLQTLGGDCTGSELEPHDGFQNAPRCVGIAFGEVAAEDKSPSLLIVDPPTAVGAGEDFTLQVSTRNLVRDRFLGAAAGGYYRESSFLNAEGIQRGHFHTACRLLSDLTLAPDAQPVPAFFLATQDNGGGSEPDLVGVPVTGLDEPGTYQCAVWAGDGSHRVPMMQRANQTPAFDAVRITVE